MLCRRSKEDMYKCIMSRTLSRDPEARKGPGCLAPPPPLSVPPLERLSVSEAAASLMAAVAVSGAHAMHSTTWSCARSSSCNKVRSVVCNFGIICGRYFIGWVANAVIIGYCVTYCLL